MNYKSVFYVLGKIMNILGLLMLLPLFVSFYYNMQGFEEAKYSSFIIPILLLFALGMLSSCLNLRRSKFMHVKAWLYAV